MVQVADKLAANFEANLNFLFSCGFANLLCPLDELVGEVSRKQILSRVESQHVQEVSSGCQVQEVRSLNPCLQEIQQSLHVFSLRVHELLGVLVVGKSDLAGQVLDIHVERIVLNWAAALIADNIGEHCQLLLWALSLLVSSLSVLAILIY